MLTGSSPVPIKGWLLPGPGSGRAEGDFKFSQQSSITLGGGGRAENCPPLGLTASLAAPFPQPSSIFPDSLRAGKDI